MPSASPIVCGSSEPAPGYAPAGVSTTDTTGKTRLDGGYTYAVLAVGDGGDRAIDSLHSGEVARTVSLLPAVDLDIQLACGGQPCGQVDVRGQISRNGGECALYFHLPPVGPKMLEIAKLPQGELELRIETDRETPRQGRLIYRVPLAADLHVALDVPIIGGPHALQGSVRFPDGAPPGGWSFYTTVHVSCDNGLARHRSPNPSSGVFTITRLPQVPCRVSATHSGSRKGRWRAPVVNVIPGSAAAVRLVLAQEISN